MTTFHADPLEHLLRMVERLAPTGYLGDGMRAQMQDCARRVRQQQCGHERTETMGGVERCLSCGQQRLVSATAFGAALDAYDRGEAPHPGPVANSITVHARERQGDEIACSCGRRWGVDEAAACG